MKISSGNSTFLARWAGPVLKYGIPLAVSVGLCWLLFSGDGIDPVNMWQTVKNQCNFYWIFANLLLGLTAQVLRAYRWRIQLRALNIHPRLSELILSMFGTYSVNLVLPRLGEVWRTGYIASRTNSPFTSVFGSMVADRLTDTITVGLMLAAVSIPAGARLSRYLAESGNSAATSFFAIISQPGIILLIIGVILIIATLFIRYPEHKAIRKIRRLAQSLWKGFAVIATMPGKGRWLILTAAIWLCYFFSFYCAMLSFPLTAQVIAHEGVIAVAVIFILSSISMAVPSNGGIGPWQWAVMLGLMLYAGSIPGLTREYALTFANLVMGAQTLMLIIQGLFTFGTIALLRHPATESES